MSIFSKVLNVIGDITGIDSVGEAAKSIAKAIAGNPEVEAKLKEAELEEVKLMIKEGEGIRNLWIEEIKSGDAFVRRARPWGLYMGYTLILIDLGLIPLFNTLSTLFNGPVMSMNNLPTQFYALFGTMFTGSLVYRAVDKRRTINGN